MHFRVSASTDSVTTPPHVEGSRGVLAPYSSPLVLKLLFGEISKALLCGSLRRKLHLGKQGWK